MNNLLNKKKIILIIGGGIAAYKSLDLIRLLKKQEANVELFLYNGKHKIGMEYMKKVQKIIQS